MELALNNFKITDVGGEKNLQVELSDATNMYIEGGNIHKIDIMDETDMPLSEAPSIEVRGAELEFFKYDEDWLMRWLDEQSMRRMFPIGYALGKVTISGEGPYTVSTATSLDPLSMISNAAWIAPVYKGNLSPVLASGSKRWIGLACAKDALRLVSAEYDGYIYVSANGGTTWTQKAASRKWTCLAGKDTGSTGSNLYCIAGVESGYLYTSKDDGATWTERTGAGSRNWRAVAISEDNLIMYAVATDGRMFLSRDEGATWSQNVSSLSKTWADVSSSVNGLIKYACYSGGVYKSSDAGKRWLPLDIASGDYRGIACSNNGLVVVAAPVQGPIAVSYNGGKTWTYGDTRSWTAVCCIATGATMYATALDSGIYKSTDSGLNWTQVSTVTGSWSAIECSDDGLNVIAIKSGTSGKTYISTDGNTFTEKGSTADYRDCGCSDDGTKMYTCIYAGKIRLSTDSGANWADSGSTSANWNCISVSSDGATVYASGSNLALYKSADSGVSFTAQDTPLRNWIAVDVKAKNNICMLESQIWCLSISDYEIENAVTFSAPTGMCCSKSGELAYVSMWGKGVQLLTQYGRYQSTLYLKKKVPFVECSDSGDDVIFISEREAYISNNRLGTVSIQGISPGASTSNFWHATISYDGQKAAVSIENGNVLVRNNTGRWSYENLSSVGTHYLKYATDTLMSVTGGRLTFEEAFNQAKKWVSVCCDADGSKIWGAVENDYLYESTDGGVTYTAKTNSGQRSWVKIACDDTGTKVIGCVNNGGIYKTEDEGTSFSLITDSESYSWNDISCNKDLSKFVATRNGGYIYISDDGSTYSEYTTVDKGIAWCSMSKDGDIVHYAPRGYEARIGKFGTTWTFERKSKRWVSVTTPYGDNSFTNTCKMYACESDGYVYESNDGGETWDKVVELGEREWTSVSASTLIDGRAWYYAASMDGAWEKVGTSAWVKIDNDPIYFAHHFKINGASEQGIIKIKDKKVEIFQDVGAGGVTSVIPTDIQFDKAEIDDNRTSSWDSEWGYSYYRYLTLLQKGSSVLHRILLEESTYMVYWNGAEIEAIPTPTTAPIIDICKNKTSIMVVTQYWKSLSLRPPGTPVWQYGKTTKTYNPAVYKVTYYDDGSVDWNKEYEPANDPIAISSGYDGKLIMTSRDSNGVGSLVYFSNGLGVWSGDDTVSGRIYDLPVIGVEKVGATYFINMLLLSTSGASNRLYRGLWTPEEFGAIESFSGVSTNEGGDTAVYITSTGTVLFTQDEGETFTRVSSVAMTQVSMSPDSNTISYVDGHKAYIGTFNSSPIEQFGETTSLYSCTYCTDTMQLSAEYGGSGALSANGRIAYSGYFHSSADRVDTSIAYHRPYKGKADSDSFTSDLSIPAGDYYVYTGKFEYVTNITDVDTFSNFGVFADTISNKLIKAYVTLDVPSVLSLFSPSVLTDHNDLIWYTTAIEQFGSRLAMANVKELINDNACSNGDFTSGSTGWGGSFTIDATGGISSGNCAKLVTGGSLNQSITSQKCKLIFKAKGDVAGLLADYQVEADTVNAGWYRCVKKGYTSGKIDIVYSGNSTLYIDNVIAWKMEDHSASVYVSDAGNYQSFSTGTGATIEFPNNSQLITGIKTSGQFLFVIKKDVTGTISETGDTQNPFAVNEGAYAYGGVYPVRFREYFAVIAEENNKAILLAFTGAGYQQLNDMWDSPYSAFNPAMPTFEIAPIYSSIWGAKHIIWQDGSRGKWGCVIDGFDKVGTVKCNRIISGVFSGKRSSFEAVEPDFVKLDSLGLKMWTDVAARGQYLIACAKNGGLYFSVDSGEKWSDAGLPGYLWSAVDISEDGTTMIAVSEQGYMYKTIDSGQNWTLINDFLGMYLTSVSLYEDKILTCERYGKLWYSADLGSTWVSIGTDKYWADVVCGEDNKFYAAEKSGYLYWYTEEDGLNEILAAGNREWTALNMSIDGAYIAACAKNNFIVTSHDSGTKWIDRVGAAVAEWTGIDISEDGTEIVACANNWYIATSKDSGETWSRKGTKQYWSAISVGDKTIALSSLDAVDTNNVQEYVHEDRYLSCITPDFSVMIAKGKITGKIYYSTDLGYSFTETGDHDDRVFAISDDGLTLYGISHKGGSGHLTIESSTDYGENWTTVYDHTGDTEDSYIYNSAMVLANGNILIHGNTADYENDRYCIYNGASTWYYSLPCTSPDRKIVIEMNYSGGRNYHISYDSGNTFTPLVASIGDIWTGLWIFAVSNESKAIYALRSKAVSGVDMYQNVFEVHVSYDDAATFEYLFDYQRYNVGLGGAGSQQYEPRPNSAYSPISGDGVRLIYCNSIAGQGINIRDLFSIFPKISLGYNGLAIGICTNLNQINIEHVLSYWVTNGSLASGTKAIYQTFIRNEETGYVYIISGLTEEDTAPEYAHVTMSINAGNSDLQKYFKRIRVFDENGVTYGIEFIDPTLPEVSGNTAYGLALSARRFVIRIKPESDNAVINQIGLTYDLAMLDDKF